MLNDTIFDGFPYFRMIDGVDIFFVLSGFLIGNILLKTINEKENFSALKLLRFWKRRWFRTLPNYYLILLANYVVVKNGIIHEKIDRFSFHFITFTQNFKSPSYGFFWESWSLSIEEWFYLFSPILIFIFIRFTTAKISFLTVTLIMILLPLVYRYFIYDPNIDHFWWDVTFRKTVICRLDSIGYGLLGGYALHYLPHFWSRLKYYSFLAGVGLILLILNYDAPVTSLYQQTIFFSIVPLSVLLCLPLMESIKKGKGILSFAVQHISKISYSMYLINLALVAEVIRDNYAPTGGVDGIIKYLIYWTVVVVVSTLLYKYFEKPIMNLRDKNFRIFNALKG